MARLAFRKRVSTTVRKISARIPRRSQGIFFNPGPPNRSIPTKKTFSRKRVFLRKKVTLGRPVFIKIPKPARMPVFESRIKTPTEQTKTQIRNLASFPKSASLLSAKKAIDKRGVVAMQGTIDFTKNVFFLFGILGLVFLFNRK